MFKLKSGTPIFPSAFSIYIKNTFCKKVGQKRSHSNGRDNLPPLYKGHHRQLDDSLVGQLTRKITKIWAICSNTSAQVGLCEFVALCIKSFPIFLEFSTYPSVPPFPSCTGLVVKLTSLSNHKRQIRIHILIIDVSTFFLALGVTLFFFFSDQLRPPRAPIWWWCWWGSPWRRCRQGGGGRREGRSPPSPGAPSSLLPRSRTCLGCQCQGPSCTPEKEQSN